jgi:predicted TIM-barrel fold metal-dependent hydrolase
MSYDFKAANNWIASEIKKDHLARGHFIVKPTDDPEWVRQEVKRLGLHGLKPFFWFSEVKDISMAEIPDYLPENIAKVADEEGWTITLHLSRRKSMADDSNIFWIQEYCKKYPGMNIILDHSARGFNPYNALEGLSKLEKGINNLWTDTSANCAPIATIAALRFLGIDRVLYASDFYVSHLRGTHVGINDNFLFLGEELPIWNKNILEACKPTFVGLENLRAVKAAFWAMGFGDKEIEKYFWGNAKNLFNL